MTTKQGEFLSKRVQKDPGGSGKTFGRNWKLVKDHKDPRKRVWHLIEKKNGKERIVRKRIGAINIGGNIGTKIQRSLKKGQENSKKNKEILAANIKKKKEQGYVYKNGKWIKDPNKKTNVVKKESFAKDRVGSVDLKSPDYLKAKRINEQEVKYQTNELKDKSTVPETEDNKKKETPKYKQITKEELKKIQGKKEKLKIKKFIKKKKGKGFVSTSSPRGKQLLKIEERKRKLREKRFGKK